MSEKEGTDGDGQETIEDGKYSEICEEENKIADHDADSSGDSSQTRPAKKQKEGVCR